MLLILRQIKYVHGCESIKLKQNKRGIFYDQIAIYISVQKQNK